MINTKDYCIICNVDDNVDCTMRCFNCANDIIVEAKVAKLAVVDARVKLKNELVIISKGSLSPSVRTFRVIVPDEYACKHPAVPNPNRLYVGFTIGRNMPVIRWENAPTNIGIELLIKDSFLISAVEDAVVDYIRMKDRSFFQRHFNSK